MHDLILYLYILPKDFQSYYMYNSFTTKDYKSLIITYLIWFLFSSQEKKMYYLKSFPQFLIEKIMAINNLHNFISIRPQKTQKRVH